MTAKKKHTKLKLTAEELRAFRRQRVARKEREEKLKNTTLTDEEKHDIYTLTQPGYAFWAAIGCRNFHLRYCKKLSNLTGLIGFALYDDAIAYGYSPCKRCKPSAKCDVVLSIPIDSKTRMNELPIDLEILCEQYKYDYCYEDDNRFFRLKTAVGIWLIHLNTYPVKLDHINLNKSPNETEFHRQPRLFLSLYDVFHYIKKHDNLILDRIEKDSNDDIAT